MRNPARGSRPSEAAAVGERLLRGHRRSIAAVSWTVCLLSTVLSAQQQLPAPPAGGSESAGKPARAESHTPANLPDCSWESQETAAGHLHLTGNVQCELPDGVMLSADVMDVYTDDDDKSRIDASGNVVFDGPEGHIAAERLQYDTSTGTGTFTTARGLLTIKDHTPQSFAGREALVYFFGERLEKLGPRRYRVTRGNWTTCEQPTPRWHFTATSMMINLEDYVVARSTVLRVKGVPLFYLPWFYYPIQNDDRATGFLMPSYGASTFRGQAFSNAFFWAISRNQDATFMHDWFTRAGQGGGVEYRYVLNPQSSGNFRGYVFERQETHSSVDGVATTLPGSTSFELSGNATQALWPGATLRTRLDYFSDVQSQQLLHQNPYEASRRNRIIEGALTASYGSLLTNVIYQRNEIINDATDTILYGSTPRATASLVPRRLFQTPLYASMNAEYAYLPQRRTVDGLLIQDDSFGRLDVAPSVRVPLSRLSFLSLNTSATYRTTYYTRQAGLIAPTQPGSYFRQYAMVRADMVGPVLTRIFDLPESNFAERLKHVIEPSLTMDFTSPIDDYRRTPILSDISDFVVGDSTRVTYGLTNRLFSRSRAVGTSRGVAREFLTIGVQQTYYSQPEASRYDGNYVSAQGSGLGREFSPVAFNVRVSPTGTFDANSRIEYDASGGGLRMITTGATVTSGQSGATLNYSWQRFDRTQPAGSFLSASTRTRIFDERIAATYSVSVDLGRSYIVSQGIVASYMAQCCGIQGEYQTYNYPAGSGLPESDRRINFAFVLAGIGTFSNFFGAFGGR
jgi:LPS-assembly protein